MDPAHPPLPTAWSFPFHPAAGSHISIWMSESLVGLSVAATRQNAGRSLSATAGAGVPPNVLPGGMNSPAATGCASVMVVPGSASEARLSHVAAQEDAANTAKTRNNFMRYSFSRELQQTPRVALVNLLLVGGRDIQALNAAYGFANVEAGLRFEGHVGSKHRVIHAEEIQTALGGGLPAKQGRVGVEVAEIVHRPLLHGLAQRDVIFVRSSRAKHVPAVADASLKVRNHPAHVMRDDLEIRPAIEHAGEHDARHRRAGFIGPPEGPPDFVFRFRFGLVVREIGATRGVHQYGEIAAGGVFKYGRELGRVEGFACDVGVNLKTARIQF